MNRKGKQAPELSPEHKAYWERRLTAVRAVLAKAKTLGISTQEATLLAYAHWAQVSKPPATCPHATLPLRYCLPCPVDRCPMESKT